MPVRSRGTLFAPNMFRRSVAYRASGGRQIIPGFSVAGELALLAVIGWSGTENCGVSDGTTVTVKFNQNPNYTDQTGISITNTTTGSVFSISSTEDAGPNTLAYIGTWPVADPAAGDVLVWAYDDGTGNYETDEGEPMASGTLTLVNCTMPLLAIASIQTFQEEAPGAGNRIVRKSMIAVE